MDTEFARRQMVGQQVRAWDVFDPNVLQVLGSASRDVFVPADFRDLAFADTEIPLPHGQKMMTPTVEGRVLQALALTRNDKVLEIGTGSAYLTACLSRLAGTVFSIDIFEDFVSAARDRMQKQGIENVDLACMDACEDLPEGEFDAIAVTGSLPRFDDRYVARLRPGGRLFVVVGEPPVQEARIVRRNNDTGWESTALFETALAPLINSSPPPEFVF
ncbi:MAG: protein-L-isoaspartate O-methyltransferase [Gammaproteobacteria bacterium]|nr:protein-L-isoaspartate O-methyltransferase [Gammaproteobacteria bacterium]MDH4313592.1 protein-L-isoaspartate O-methyltransferase [Gammaproteobacteria bacterium]MDH5213357.1 protein-L-isoaspartate O-methyltransferase [Gammaproteobacteria bacterium]MDH5500014.1 protein-L-isoaspartate O-methyltransferase [Gammaproteobacteria bacterium]